MLDTGRKSGVDMRGKWDERRRRARLSRDRGALSALVTLSFGPSWRGTIGREVKKGWELVKMRTIIGNRRKFGWKNAILSKDIFSEMQHFHSN